MVQISDFAVDFPGAFCKFNVFAGFFVNPDFFRILPDFFIGKHIDSCGLSSAQVFGAQIGDDTDKFAFT